ncbi:MAG: thioredoxin family protein [Promethearchaeota archaeon]
MVQVDVDLLKANSMDYESYLQTMTATEKDIWEKDYEKVILNDELKRLLKSPSRPINIIVFSKSWCGECAMAVPMLEKMARLSTFLTLYIVERDQCPELYEPFMPNGDKRVPVVLFTSEDYYVVTQWVERCAIKFGMIWDILQEMKGRPKEEIFEQRAKTVKENMEIIRKATIEELSAELLRTVGTINYSSRLKTALNS